MDCTSLVAPQINGDKMKLFAKQDLVVDQYGCLRTHLLKEPDFIREFNSYTSGHIKYLALPEGTVVRVTLEVLEDGDSSQQIQI